MREHNHVVIMMLIMKKRNRVANGTGYICMYKYDAMALKVWPFVFFFFQGKHAKGKQYVGHSAHVTIVRFSHDDKRLISLGGGDTSLMVWKHAAGSRDPAMETDQSEELMPPSSFSSEDSDTDSEEEGETKSMM